MTRSISTLAALALTLSAVACGVAEEPTADAQGFDEPTCADCGDDDIVITDLGEPRGESSVCATVQIDYEPVTPTVVLLIDQSGSMTDSYDGGSRWDVLYDSLMNEDTGVVKALDGEVRFGLSLFTSYNGNEDGAVCPVLTEVESTLGNHEAIDAIYGDAEPQDETPTGEALVVVAENLAELEAAGPKVVILATDGEPDTCAHPNPQEGQQVAVAAAQGAYAQGITTFVLGVGDDVGAEHLQDMANAGQGLALDAETPASFYRPESKEQLLETFGDIIQGQRDCVIPLDAEIDADIAETGTVTLDGETLEYGSEWKLNGNQHIELVGDACNTVMTGDHEVSGEFFCSAPADVGPVK